ncbi:hypothetical protein D3C86_457540 [compost metagenome]
MQKILTGLALGTALVVGLQTNANAQMKTSKPASTSIYSSAASTENHLFGIGYKLGNGLDFAGADLIVNPLPNVSLDLQAAMVDGRLGVAPAIQYHLDPAGGPYIGAGYGYVRGNDTVASNHAAFANVGYQYKPVSNVGIIVGIGYRQFLRPTTEGSFNYEAGVRYFFM